MPQTSGAVALGSFPGHWDSASRMVSRWGEAGEASDRFPLPGFSYVLQVWVSPGVRMQLFLALERDEPYVTSMSALSILYLEGEN